MCLPCQSKLNIFVNTTHPKYTPIKNDDAIVDSGATNHVLLSSAPVDERAPANTPRYCGTPTGHTMTSTEQGLIPHNLPRPAREGHLYPGLTYRSLVSVGQICDSNYTI